MEKVIKDEELKGGIVSKDVLRGLLRTIKMHKDEPGDRVLGRVMEKIEREL